MRCCCCCTAQGLWWDEAMKGGDEEEEAASICLFVYTERSGSSTLLGWEEGGSEILDG